MRSYEAERGTWSNMAIPLNGTGLKTWTFGHGSSSTLDFGRSHLSPAPRHSCSVLQCSPIRLGFRHHGWGSWDETWSGWRVACAREANMTWMKQIWTTWSESSPCRILLWNEGVHPTHIKRFTGPPDGGVNSWFYRDSMCFWLLLVMLQEPVPILCSLVKIYTTCKLNFFAHALNGLLPAFSNIVM